MLTSYKEDDLVKAALEAGATSYLLKSVTADELAEAIQKAYSGKTTLAPEAAEALIRAAVSPPGPGHDLTEREREVLALMVEGITNRQIADRLTVSTATANFMSEMCWPSSEPNRGQRLLRSPCVTAW